MINFLNCAHYEKEVGYNKEIIKKYHIYYQTFELLTHLGQYVECA